MSPARALSARATRTVRARSKYGAVPTLSHGIRFHSAAEARRYEELLILQKVGHVWGVECQPRFALTVMGVKLGTYVGDFRFYEVGAGGGSRLVIEDVKGAATLPLAKWKQKHLSAQYGIEVREIRRR